MVYLITTTYRRDTQKADLVVLCQTLMHVQSLVWILVENSMQHTPMIGALLKRCGLPYVHLTVSSPDHTYVRATSEIVGIQHRNVGLKWIREHCGNGKCNSGVVYFGDDDDRYDLRLFDEVLVWRSRTMQPETFRECYDRSSRKWGVRKYGIVQKSVWKYVLGEGEQLKYKTADGARLDVVAENIWSKNRLKAFFDVKVFNPFSKSYANTPLAQCHRHLEQDKRSLSLRLTVLIPSTVNSKSS
eukprot:Em0002g925a